jgi:hypothetical protein
MLAFGGGDNGVIALFLHFGSASAFGSFCAPWFSFCIWFCFCVLLFWAWISFSPRFSTSVFIVYGSAGHCIHRIFLSSDTLAIHLRARYILGLKIN